MGRKKKEPTKVVRIPSKFSEEVEKLLIRLRKKDGRTAAGKLKTIHPMP